jgi:hypothetical protein
MFEQFLPNKNKMLQCSTVIRSQLNEALYNKRKKTGIQFPDHNGADLIRAKPAWPVASAAPHAGG